MPNWNTNLITLTAKTDEAKKQLHTFIDKHVIVIDNRNWNESLLDIDNDSIIPKPEGIVKLMKMGQILQGYNEFKTNPTYDKDAENKQRAQNRNKQREQNRKDYGYEDWYDFCNNVWGSKWGFCHTAFLNDYGEVIDTKDDLHSNLESTGEIDIKTDCAWSPAQGLMKKICELYPDIEFRCEWGEEQVTEYYGILTYDYKKGWEEKYKSEIDVGEAYNMLDRLGLLNADEDDGYFPNHSTGLVDYDERLDADSETYIPKDQRDGIIFGHNG